MMYLRIILLTVVVSCLVSDACKSTASVGKRRTTSRIFQKLRTNATKMCQYIDKDFDKLKGHWYYTLRTVVPPTPKIRCGQLTVSETSENGFESTLLFITPEGEPDEVSLTGKFVSETIIEIPQLNKLISGSPKLYYPFIAQMGICDEDSIMFIEPMFYSGGGMIFTRAISNDVSGLKVRFGTYDEEMGKESTVRVGTNCSMTKFEGKW